MSGDDRKRQATPVIVHVEQGRAYDWCKCGLTATRPLCDGSQGSDCTPLRFVAGSTDEVIMCGCGESDDPPFCDGTHNVI